MTVGKQLHQTLASLRKARADMEAYAQETQDQNAQQLYSNSAEQLGQLVNGIEGRTNYVEQQEPQFKTKQKQQQQQQQNQ